VLIIADQLALGVGRQGGLASAGEAEEDRHIAVFADIGRAVHGGNALQRQQVVHYREHAFLHLAAVPGAADQLHALGHVEGDEVLGVETLFLPVGIGGFGAVQHHKVGYEVFQLGIGRADKHVFHKVRLPGHLGDKAHLEAAAFIGAAEQVHHKQALAAQLVADHGLEGVPHLGSDRLVVVLALVVPPQGVTGHIILDEVFVLGGAPGEFTGIDIDRSQFCYHTRLVA